MNDKHIYDRNRLHVSLAGSGNPWNALTRLRLGVLRGLYDNLSLPGLAAAFEMSVSEIEAEITPLVEVNLVTEQDGSYRPTFFIASSLETQSVTEHAKTVGKALTEHLLVRWSEIETAYSQLNVSHNYSLFDLAFMLVGSRILDIGLLEALKQDKRLMPPAPARPSPDRPNAHYYFWMIEGDLEQLGKYGQNDTALPGSQCAFLTFGQNYIGGVRNRVRDALEEKCEKIACSQIETPESLAKLLKVPLINQNDVQRWFEVVKKCTKDLLNVYHENEGSIRQLYTSLQASDYAPHSFGEFFCWYAHVAYAWAIDTLIEKGVMSLPEDRFSAVLWEQLPKNEVVLK